MKTQPSAKVIADSVNVDGDRLITIEATMHRFVLSEFNTHRVFSRNSASSRAIPVKKQLEKIQKDPALPIEYGTNKRGMQAGESLKGLFAGQANYHWLKARDAAYIASERISGDLNVHKQVANRILEPWMWHTVIFSATEFDNFFEQRCSPLAQPEICDIANKIRSSIKYSTPNHLGEGDWHLPYIQDDENDLDLETKKMVSAARCARVSYLTHDGVKDIDKDIELYDRLINANPPHWSPLEHVATPDISNKVFLKSGEKVFPVSVIGNFVGWRQLRHDIQGVEFV